jgi:hypothetical protein
MQALNSAAVEIDACDEVEFPFECPDNSELENRVVSPCGRFESFDYKGNHFEIDWDEIVGDEDEEEIPHEQVMEETRIYCEELAARRAARR